MSKRSSTASSSSSLDDIIEESLKKYEEETNKSLRPLIDELELDDKCDDKILALFRAQVKEFKEFASGDEKLMKSLKPIVKVLCASSSVIGAGVGLVFKPASVIFAGVDVLLSAAKDVIASHEALIEIFERMAYFFNRLEEYTGMPNVMAALKGVIVEIMTEVLKIFGIMTKEIKRGRARRLLKEFLKKLIGSDVIQDALNRLGDLTHEEVNTVIVQILKSTHRIEGGVDAARAELKVVSDNVVRVMKDGKDREAHEDEKKQRQMIEAGRRRVREDKKWLSPPDPSTNQSQNVAFHASHARRTKGTGRMAKWFFEGNISTEWKKPKSSTPLLWIHGKLGSGKSVLCSAIIKDIMALQQDGLATMAYFYFDFKDTNKQSLHKALLSLLTHLSASSDSYCDILSHVYKEHNNGAYQPDTERMVECLKEMLRLPNQRPVYIILDALDECPKTSGVPPARQEVLDLLEDLVNLRLSNLHICATSRRESDIETALQRLRFHSISIHDQSGQNKDIEDYIRSVVYAESDTAMGGWSEEDRELVIKTLTERADGMCQWVFCQLQVLQHCDPESISQTLDELPDSLDGTYERVLKEIGKASRRLQDLALRLLQCLTVAIRPLRVEELTEILALNFDEAEGAIPKVTSGPRSENQLRMVLSTCSSFVTLVDNGHPRVIQFSHFSVKEFLTCGRLTMSQGCISLFHIEEELAHTTLAQACLGTLLHLGGSLKLKRYAGQHWVEHARFEKVSSRIEDGIRRLFESPYLATLLQLDDFDDCWTEFGDSAAPRRGSPLYYASLCGFRDLAAHIIDEHPGQVNARGGRNHSPLAAALYKKHFDVAKLLRQHGAKVDVTGYGNRTPLRAASVGGRSDIARWLLDYGADPNSQQDDHRAPIYLATANGHLEVVRTLLKYKVRIDAADKDGRTSLHLASSSRETEIVRLLLDHGANANAEDKDGRTPLYLTWAPQVARLLLDKGASADLKNEEGRTVLQVLLRMGKFGIVQTMLDHGAQI